MRKPLLLLLPVVAAICLTSCSGPTDKTTNQTSTPEVATPSQSAAEAPEVVAKDTDSKWEVGEQLVQGKKWGSEEQPLEELKANVAESEKTPDMRLVMALRDLAGWYRGQKQYEDAEKIYKRIRDMEADRLGITDGSLPWNDLGVLYTDMGKLADAEDQFKRLTARFKGESPAPAQNDRIAIVFHNYSYLLDKLGRADEAKKMEDKADELMAEKKAAIDQIR